MTGADTASETIAKFAAGFDRARMSPATVQRCGRALADTLAVGMAGLREPSVRQALRYVEGSAPQVDGGNGRPASARLWGTSIELSGVLPINIVSSVAWTQFGSLCCIPASKALVPLVDLFLVGAPCGASTGP